MTERCTTKLICARVIRSGLRLHSSERKPHVAELISRFCKKLRCILLPLKARRSFGRSSVRKEKAVLVWTEGRSAEKKDVFYKCHAFCAWLLTVICIKDYSHRECTSLTDLRGLFFPVVANEFGPEGFWETVCHRRIQYPFIPGIGHLCHASSSSFFFISWIQGPLLKNNNNVITVLKWSCSPDKEHNTWGCLHTDEHHTHGGFISHFHGCLHVSGNNCWINDGGKLYF